MVRLVCLVVCLVCVMVCLVCLMVPHGVPGCVSAMGRSRTLRPGLLARRVLVARLEPSAVLLRPRPEPGPGALVRVRLLAPGQDLESHSIE